MHPFPEETEEEQAANHENLVRFVEEEQWRELEAQRPFHVAMLGRKRETFEGPKVSNKPHPQSYGTEYPLEPLTFAQLVKPTAEEKRLLAARPITLRLYDIDSPTGHGKRTPVEHVIRVAGFKDSYVKGELRTARDKALESITWARETVADKAKTYSIQIEAL